MDVEDVKGLLSQMIEYERQKYACLKCKSDLCNVALLPCAHVALCRKCCEHTKYCPVCGGEVTHITDVYHK